MGAGIILGGVVSLSLITATVASVFIERKFRRERGLEPVKVTQHILLLGWNEEGEALLDQLLKRLPPDIPLVLVNKQPPEQMEALQDRYPTNPPIFLRGDYSREEVLLKANVRQAVKAIILAERQPEETAAQVDQRTLFTALTLKAIHPKIRILAELLRSENRTYLERAGAEDVLIRGQYDSSLLAGAIASPGIYRVLTTLLVAEGQNLWSVEIPSRFHGRPLSELAAHLRDHHQSLLIAIYTEARALSLEDLLAEEPSAIDDFIRRKFAETKMTHLLGRTKVDYQVNPPGDHDLGTPPIRRSHRRPEAGAVMEAAKEAGFFPENLSLPGPGGPGDRAGPGPHQPPGIPRRQRHHPRRRAGGLHVHHGGAAKWRSPSSSPWCWTKTPPRNG